MKRKTDLLMFDFDGTLVDSRHDIAASTNYLLAARGLPPKEVDLIAGFIGDGIRTLLRKALEIDDHDEVEEAVRVFREHYWDHCLDETRDYPGVREGLEALRGKRKAVVTNKAKRFADKILGELGLADHFVMVVGGEGPYAKKPSPEAFEAVLGSLGVEGEKALVVGDSINDINGGRAAGCVTCAVTYGIGERSVLEAASPDMMIDSITELPEKIE